MVVEKTVCSALVDTFVNGDFCTNTKKLHLLIQLLKLLWLEAVLAVFFIRQNFCYWKICGCKVRRIYFCKKRSYIYA